MVILINGAFGIGKTTVARLLSQRLPASLVFDPEPVGVLLQRSRRLLGVPVEDFQDLPAWRRLSVFGVRAWRRLRPNVIVPMAFSNLSYLQEIRDGIARFEPRVFHFCLVAPESVVTERLRRRRHGVSPRDLSWQLRRAAECCAVHMEATFAEQVPASDRTPEDLVDLLLERIRGRIDAA
jgi:hypothetical protein